MHRTGWPLRRPAPQRAEDPWRELEGFVDRVARLVLNAQALADRMAGLPEVRAGRDERVRRLRQAVRDGQLALEAAAGTAR